MKLLSLLIGLFLCLVFVSNSRGAVGDVVVDCQDIAAGSDLAIQPASGDEWVLHSVSFERNTLLKRTDGTDTANMSAEDWIGPDHFLFNPAIHLTNGNYINAENQHATLAGVICYTGVKTKE